MRARRHLLTAAVIGLASASAQAQVPGEQPALGTDRITQAEIESGLFTVRQIRREGMRVFSTPFNKLDGFGDGPMDPNDTTSPGGRPTMGGNGTFLRVNGLDSQTCLECHSVLQASTIPARFAVGGSAGIGGTAMPGPTEIDIDDSEGNGFAAFNGRLINPPFVFGAGGVEQIAKEMTLDLQALKAQAELAPGVAVSLDTKGVNFGTITYDDVSGALDTSDVEGIDENLVVQPFGRKGNNATIRVFDRGALMFHHGMQPEEVVGTGVDDDGDGVVDEILTGELSALHIFSTSLERPIETGTQNPRVAQGFQLFNSMGCADCHVPELQADSALLTLSFPEVAEDPTANPYYVVDLVNGTAGFQSNGAGGAIVRMYSDLKRHMMGDALEETTGDALDPWFITPRLWGLADSAPYLHDGRALTVTDAILAHEGEGAAASQAFDNLSDRSKRRVLTFLKSLRTPTNPSPDLK